MKKVRLASIVFLLGIAAIPFAIVSAQREQATVMQPQTSVAPISNQMPQKLQCSAKNAGGEKPTYLVGAANLSAAETQRIKNMYGLAIPRGEAKRAKKIRAAALERQ